MLQFDKYLKELSVAPQLKYSQKLKSLDYRKTCLAQDVLFESKLPQINHHHPQSNSIDTEEKFYIDIDSFSQINSSLSGHLSFLSTQNQICFKHTRINIDTSNLDEFDKTLEHLIKEEKQYAKLKTSIPAYNPKNHIEGCYFESASKLENQFFLVCMNGFSNNLRNYIVEQYRLLLDFSLPEFKTKRCDSEYISDSMLLETSKVLISDLVNSSAADTDDQDSSNSEVLVDEFSQLVLSTSKNDSDLTSVQIRLLVDKFLSPYVRDKNCLRMISRKLPLQKRNIYASETQLSNTTSGNYNESFEKYITNLKPFRSLKIIETDYLKFFSLAVANDHAVFVVSGKNSTTLIDFLTNKPSNIVPLKYKNAQFIADFKETPEVTKYNLIQLKLNLLCKCTPLNWILLYCASPLDFNSKLENFLLLSEKPENNTNLCSCGLKCTGRSRPEIYFSSLKYECFLELFSKIPKLSIFIINRLYKKYSNIRNLVKSLQANDNSSLSNAELIVKKYIFMNFDRTSFLKQRRLKLCTDPQQKKLLNQQTRLIWR